MSKETKITLVSEFLSKLGDHRERPHSIWQTLISTDCWSPISQMGGQNKQNFKHTKAWEFLSHGPCLRKLLEDRLQNKNGRGEPRRRGLHWDLQWAQQCCNKQNTGVRVVTMAQQDVSILEPILSSDNVGGHLLLLSCKGLRGRGPEVFRFPDQGDSLFSWVLGPLNFKLSWETRDMLR